MVQIDKHLLSTYFMSDRGKSLHVSFSGKKGKLQSRVVTRIKWDIGWRLGGAK